jgi:hypothetical protein
MEGSRSKRTHCVEPVETITGFQTVWCERQGSFADSFDFATELKLLFCRSPQLRHCQGLAKQHDRYPSFCLIGYKVYIFGSF